MGNNCGLSTCVRNQERPSPYDDTPDDGFCTRDEEELPFGMDKPSLAGVSSTSLLRVCGVSPSTMARPGGDADQFPVSLDVEVISPRAAPWAQGPGPPAADPDPADGPAEAAPAPAFEVELTRRQQGFFGFFNAPLKEGGLQVKKIIDGGVLASYNEEGGKPAVLEEAIIHGVNGARGDPEQLRQVLRSSSVVRLAVTNPPVPAQ
mmetsp:Transcript_23115/g.50942  ORF Transcript_23115/g.50942 Transcript_23115/m.50942 type:complete len:205 (-) Transcript_23115:40-654(-)